MNKPNKVEVQSSTEFNGRGYVAMTEAIPEAGAIVLWRLSGALDLAVLAEAWTDAGLPEALLPEPPSPQTALHRAVKEMAEPRVLVRPLDKRAGWAVLDERATGDDLAHTKRMTVKLDVVGRPAIDPVDHPRAADVRAAYQRHLDAMSGTDVSGWLCRLMEKVDAVGLRDTGGVYFVPRHALPTWRSMAGAIKSASGHAFLGVPAMAAEDLVATVVDSITAEAERETAQLQEQVMSGSLGERALETQIGKSNRIEAKLGRYEALLGTRLDVVRAKVAALRGNIAAAMLSVSADMGGA